jgi:hypothetical protein
MKNLISLVTDQDVHEYVGELWKSDLFRNSHVDGGYVYHQVERFAWLPRVFAESTHDHLERAHFSTWWNVIMLREYDNPIIHDLYYLHEMAHAATMPYIAGIGRAAFDEKMQRNELEASVLSEIAVYFDLPGLRETSFGHDIYADRFLVDPSMQRLWRANRDVALEAIRSERRHVMVCKPEHTMDQAEVWIRRFAEQNEAYSITWADNYTGVENFMAGFQRMGCNDRAQAARIHMEWLAEEAAHDEVDNITFLEQAEMFAPFYWANKAKYTAAMSKIEEPTYLTKLSAVMG